MDQISKTIVSKMVDMSVVSADEADAYKYSLQVLFEQALTYSTIFMISFVLNRVIETFLFVLFFSSLRKRTGGFHVSSFLGCYISSVTIYSLYSLVIYPLLLNSEKANIIMLFICTIFVLIKGAVNNDNIHWTAQEYIDTSETSRIIVITEAFCIIFTEYFLSIKSIALYMSFGTCLSAILLFAGLFQKMEVDEVGDGLSKLC